MIEENQSPAPIAECRLCCETKQIFIHQTINNQIYGLCADCIGMIDGIIHQTVQEECDGVIHPEDAKDTAEAVRKMLQG